jgi:septum formation protein
MDFQHGDCDPNKGKIESHMGMKLKFPLVLGSGSPRRQELLTSAGFDFEVVVLDIPEDIPAELEVDKVAAYLARLKSDAYRIQRPASIILTADTTVVLKGQLLGKPQDSMEAIDMLKQLSGQQHQVITGVCIRYKDQIDSFSVTTEVHFDELSLEEITYYVDTYKPFDKAGAYGIQEWIGQIGIRSINGSYYNVVGLPVRSIYQHMKLFFD